MPSSGKVSGKTSLQGKSCPRTRQPGDALRDNFNKAAHVRTGQGLKVSAHSNLGRGEVKCYRLHVSVSAPKAPHTFPREITSVSPPVQRVHTSHPRCDASEPHLLTVTLLGSRPKKAELSPIGSQERCKGTGSVCGPPGGGV